jgi:hypothetical protein
MRRNRADVFVDGPREAEKWAKDRGLELHWLDEYAVAYRAG